jgi:U3 small nucleolar RNA-associated protein 14
MGKKLPKSQMGKKIPKSQPAAAANNDEDLQTLPTCDFGYEIPSDFEDEEVDEDMGNESDESNEVDDVFLKKMGAGLEFKQLEKEVQAEAKRTGMKLLDLSDLLSDDDEPKSQRNPLQKAKPIKSIKTEMPLAEDSEEEELMDEITEDYSASNKDESEDDQDDGSAQEVDEEEDVFSCESDDGNDPKAHAALLSIVEQLSRRDDARLRRNADRLIKGNTADPGADAHLTLDALMDPLRETASFAAVKSSLDKLALNRSAKVADIPLETTDRRRLERIASYKQTKEQMDKWSHLVQTNRRAEHISFPLKQDKQNESSASLVAKFQPTNSLENDLKALTKLYKAKEDELSRGADLPVNDVSAEEVENRHAQLVQMRSLLFYHELRAKRIKKIKSKAYRKHLKKAAQKASNGEMEDVSFAVFRHQLN